jgi:hypothetical protein
MKTSNYGSRRFKEKTRRAAGVHHRRLVVEFLEDRRLLSVTAAFEQSDQMELAAPLVAPTDGNLAAVQSDSGLAAVAERMREGFISLKNAGEAYFRGKGVHPVVGGFYDITIDELAQVFVGVGTAVAVVLDVGPGVKIGVYMDAADMLGWTQDAREGYTSLFLTVGVKALGIGVGSFGGGMFEGKVSDFDNSEPDLGGGFSLLSAEAGPLSWSSSVGGDFTPFHWNVGAGIDLFSIEGTVLSVDVSNSVLRSVLRSSPLFGSFTDLFCNLTGVLPVEYGYDQLGLGLGGIYEAQVRKELPALVRPAVQPQGTLLGVLGGLDVDGNGTRDRVYPSYVGDFWGNPPDRDPFRTDILFNNTGADTLNYFVKLREAVPAGWFIGANDGLPIPLRFDQKYDVSGVQPGSTAFTKWIIAAEPNTLGGTQVTFDLYRDGLGWWENKWLGNQWLDSITVTLYSESGQEAINAGVNWLRAPGRQLANGSWSNDAATTSMAVLTMLNAGYKQTDSIVANGIQYILSQVHADGSVGHEPGRYTYRTSIAILPLVATHNAAYRTLIEKMRGWLVNSQWDESCAFGSVPQSNSYYGGFGYGSHERPDLSNTQWALMGLKAADRELNMNAADTYQKALVFLDRCRNGDGGSAYTPGDVSIHTMTAASVWSYSLCGVDATDSRIRGGINWLKDRYSVTNNDGWGYWSEYYYKVTVAKALSMSHQTKLGTHDWFADLSQALINEQNRNRQASGYGSWPDTGMGGQEMSTAWAIMALQTRTLPVGANLSMSMILKSHADLHVYDPLGKHLGVNYVTATLDQQIPGATLKYYLDANQDGVCEASEEQQPTNYLNIPVEWVQVATLPQLSAGSYRTELVGTSTGPFELQMEGAQDDTAVPGATFAGNISLGERLATTVTVTAMEGALTLLSEPLTEMPVMTVVPASAHVYVVPGTAAQGTFEVKETGGNMTLHSVNIYATDFVGPWGTIPGSSITFSPNDFDVAPGATRVVTVSGTVPGDFVGAVSGTIIVQSADGGTKSMAVTLESNPLFVTSFTPQPSGFAVQFNRAIDTTVLNLYDSQSQFFGESDVVLKDSTNKVVPGTLLVVAPDQIQFVATGGLLAAGTYSVTLRSAANGFKDAETGQLLDGEYSGTFPSGDGTPGGNFVYDTFTVAASQAIVVSLPDFARGPGQRVNVPSYDPSRQPPLDEDLNQAGLPIRLSNANGVTSVMLTLQYDPALLTITDVLSGLVPGTRTSDNQFLGSVVSDLSTPGQIGLLFYASQPLTGTNITIARLSALVPETADSLYGSAGVLHFASVSVNGSTAYATADDAVQVVALFGDANMNKGYDDQDPSLILRVAAGLDSGFAATPPWPNPVIPGTTTPLMPTPTYPLIDPLIIGDITGNGKISAMDANLVAQKALYVFEGKTTQIPYIPPLPAEQANHAPALDNSGDVILPAINEDDTNNPGILIRDLIASSVKPVEVPVHMITDPDSGALEGIAIYSADTSHGTWEYSLDNGANWNPLGAVSEASARLLASDAATRIRFKPASNFNGTVNPAITLRAWDRTSGTNGGTGNTTTHGGSTAFSDATETAAITALPINDKPTASNQSVTTAEDNAVTITLGATDVETAIGQLIYQITIQPQHGTLGPITGNQVTYTPTGNYNGPDSFQFTVKDDGDPAGSHANPGDLTSDAATVSIMVSAINDPPSFTKGSGQTVNEDAGAQTVAGWATNMSPGPPNEAGQVLDFIVSADTPALFAVQPAIDATSGTLTYTPAGNANGSSIVTVRLHDNGGTADGGQDTSAPQTFTITINPVNDAPSFTKGADQTANEDAGAQSVAGWASSISAGPADESGQTLTFQVTNDNNALFAVQPAVAANGTLTYTPANNANGSATVTVGLKDNGGTANGGVDTSPAQSFTITINPVNDPPTLDPIPDPAAINEDAGLQTVNLSGIGPGGGADEVGQVLTVTAASGNTALIPDPTVNYTSPNATGGLTYTPVTNANGTAVITVTVTDNGGGSDSFSRTFTVTVNAVNDPPTAADGTVAMSKNTEHVFLASEYSFSDVDAGDALSAVQITTLATNGALKWHDGTSWVPVVSSQEITRADIDAGKLEFVPFANETGSPYATFGFKVKDTGGPILSTSAYTMTVNVTATLLAAGDAPAGQAETAPLSQADLQPIVAEAIARWAAAGLPAQSVDAMTKAQFTLLDLPGAQLGLAAGNAIYIDRNAAGFGWFVDPTPNQDEEFARIGSEGELRATGAGAIDRMDLMSVVEHELGHLVGLDDLDSLVSSLMGSLLSKGIRRAATPREVDAVFAADDLLT